MVLGARHWIETEQIAVELASPEPRVVAWWVGTGPAVEAWGAATLGVRAWPAEAAAAWEWDAHRLGVQRWRAEWLGGWARLRWVGSAPRHAGEDQPGYAFVAGRWGARRDRLPPAC